LANGDVDGAYAAAYDAYRMAAEAPPGREGLRATGGDSSHMSVEDAVSAQFVEEVPAFAECTEPTVISRRWEEQYRVGASLNHRGFDACQWLQACCQTGIG
jgi:hypothetical protein